MCRMVAVIVRVRTQRRKCCVNDKERKTVNLSPFYLCRSMLEFYDRFIGNTCEVSHFDTKKYGHTI